MFTSVGLKGGVSSSENNITSMSKVSNENSVSLKVKTYFGYYACLSTIMNYVMIDGQR